MYCIPRGTGGRAWGGGRDTRFVKEQARQEFVFTKGSDTVVLYPRPKAMFNMYGIIEFLGGQAEKHTKRLKKGRDKQIIMERFFLILIRRSQHRR